MGDGALTFQEIEAWSRSTGYRLSAWETETLRLLSNAYAVELQAATDPLRPAPAAELAGKPDPRNVSQKLEAMFDKLAREDASMGLGELAQPS